MAAGGPGIRFSGLAATGVSIATNMGMYGVWVCLKLGYIRIYQHGPGIPFHRATDKPLLIWNGAPSAAAGCGALWTLRHRGNPIVMGLPQ